MSLPVSRFIQSKKGYSMRSNYTPARRTSTVSIMVQLTALIFMFLSMLTLAAGLTL